jgi:hypothetical protein
VDHVTTLGRREPEVQQEIPRFPTLHDLRGHEQVASNWEKKETAPAPAQTTSKSAALELLEDDDSVFYVDVPINSRVSELVLEKGMARAKVDAKNLILLQVSSTSTFCDALCHTLTGQHRSQHPHRGFY